MIQNTELFQKKKDILESLSINPNIDEDFKYTLTCLYHGVPLTFHTSNFKFYQELEDYLPKTWVSARNDAVHVYIQDFKEYSFDFDSWSEELCQDCIVEDNFVIQRDFAARLLTNKKIQLITLEKVCDGFYNFLRWYLPLELMKVNKIILHSSCMLDKDSNAHFFLGHSGAGKTTVTELSSPRTILGDDMNLLSVDYKKSIMAQAGAIGGYFKPQVNYDEEFPIKSFNWIVQSEENKRVKLSTAQARAKIMASVSNVFWESISKEQTDFIFNIVLKAATEVPLYELHFKKDSSFWSLIE
jgi:hypothetical protein